MKTISLAKGTLEPDSQMSGWVITSERAQLLNTGDPDIDVHLVKGDRIDCNGAVYHNGEHIANA
jgi:hypothetical protein